jgi:hypothetical protein
MDSYCGATLREIGSVLLNWEENRLEFQSPLGTWYAAFSLKKKKNTKHKTSNMYLV